LAGGVLGATFDPVVSQEGHPMLVIFDLDDTLVDTLSAQIAARERIMRHFALEPSNAAMDRLRLCAVDPAAAYHVGDRLSDVIAAHLARVRSVLVNAPSLAADPPAADIALDIETPLHTIDHIVDLLSIVVPAPARLQHGDRLNAGAV
jgi:phosphoglycolate phosphatase-like HAD superfamily hydrolase